MTSLGQEPLERSLTYHDLAHVPDDGNRYEIIDGSLYVTPFPSYPHQQAVTRLTSLLDQHVRRLGLGRVFTSGLKVVLDEPSGVGPDVVYVSGARMDHMRHDGFHGAPDLVVEVLSTKGLSRNNSGIRPPIHPRQRPCSSVTYVCMRPPRAAPGAAPRRPRCADLFLDRPKPELDRFIKLNKYASAGIPHYWIVSPEHRTLWAYRLDGARYRLADERRDDQSFTPDLFPGLTVFLHELWV